MDLIVGSAPLLALRLAAHLLNTTDHDVCRVVDSDDIDFHYLKNDRFRLVRASDYDATSDCRDAWVLSTDDLEADKRLIALAQQARPVNLNHVGRSAALATAIRSHLNELRATVSDRRDACFCFDGVFDLDPSEYYDDDLVRIARAVRNVIREVQERWSEYFDWSPLKLRVDPNHKFQLLPVDEAVRMMFKLEKTSPSEIYFLGSSQSITAEYLCACLSRISHVNLKPVGSAGPLNAIDQLLADRLRETGSILSLPPNDGEIVRIKPEQSATDERLVETMLRRAYETHAARDDERTQQVAAQNLQTKTVAVGDDELTYHQAGHEGSPLILLGALGQGINWWARLIQPLMQRHRVYVWEPRGVTTPASHVIGLDDHATDIEAVMAAEQISSCVLIGWCNGPQCAVEFYERHPEMVRGMVFLNCTFEVPGRPELDAPYEKYFRKLCEVITTRPEFAPSAMKTLAAVPEPKRDDLIALPDDKRAETVIRLAPQQLRPHVARPFATVDTTRRYAAQVLDYFAHDSLAHASEIETPLLVLSAEYDSVVAPERVEAIAACFPRSSYFSISGATHYALYAQSETVAGKIERFLSEYC